ncbi:MAG: carbamoyltransferase HypF [Chloroflexi bacterium RBG_13_51_36]|nr:MAG: carbamoyltransferase HypF [Chloroflexi bacterium RBG_13_51_36]
MSKAAKQSLKSASISVRGIVQGVGFRPFVYGLAVKHNLKGWVYNTSEDVRIEVEGSAEAIKQFERELKTKPPPLAHIEDTTVEYHSPVGYKNFEIRKSQAQTGKYQLVSPDVATCQACLDELLNPEDRRYRYPFTNCTNCGPRFTIIESMPYDRPRTTMRHFQMCPQCQAEYDNPLDRRFHAQPNACPKCGPQIQLVDDRGNVVTKSNPITEASEFLKEGKIVAVKGLGGFLLACDATNGTAVKTLRQRKNRPSKPLAIMVATVDEARRHCYVSPEEERLLTSPQSPIVLMKWKKNSSVSREVAPNLRFLGIMLPYTPLHHTLLRDTGLPLVMTSGNLSEEPIARDNDEALRRLSGIADYFLVHNRDIYSRYDDSVTMIERGMPQLVRRARSYAPYPIRLPFETRQVLGCGAEEKNTFCLTKDNYAFVSQHIGDMENMETLEHFDNTISLYKRLFHVEPEIVAHDLHPDYLATKYARDLGESGIRLIPVQHHHAHIASCLADNGLESPVIGVAFDGTGMGADGSIWGGEFLVADYRGFRRAGHLEYLRLPGGTAAIRRPYRIAIGYIITLLGENALNAVIASEAKQPRLASSGQITEVEVEIIKRQIERKINSPLNSSMGRLFDAMSALLGIKGEIDYEGQAAVELEMAAHEEDYVHIQENYPYRIAKEEGVGVVRLGDMLSAVIEDSHQGVLKGMISVKFHNTVARMTNEMCRLIADATGIEQVALSGGVFQNRLLLRKTVSLLESNGFRVFTHRQVPCNDGGISLGQAVIANFAV